MFQDNLRHFLRTLDSLHAGHHDIITLKIAIMKLAGKLLSEEITPALSALLNSIMDIYRLLPESNEFQAEFCEFIKSEFKNVITEYRIRQTAVGENDIYSEVA